MSNKKNLSPLAAAVGAAFLASASVSVSADSANPFAAEELSSGYNLAMADDKGQEGKCGEGKCGEGKKKEGKCGEGKCGEGKKKEGKCGEGKCGEGKKKEGKCGG
ncbi:HvfA family oxazolone/thioamide-modified RiPP metallophore [Microbulbifer sp.]|uniref:HvfA family oxazolone/thioamide-modified RiPP metallophore n=1 Tax=Microbulbifer sp. TaxID=1908541 RepID=UPI003F35940C